jgi:hypothetical protein
LQHLDPEKAKILRRRWRSLDELQKALEEIAESRDMSDHLLQAQVVRNRLIQRIEFLIDSRQRDVHYEELISPWMRQAEKPSHWLCYLVVLKDSERLALSHKKLVARAEAAAHAGVKALRPVQRRAVELLQGQRRKPTKNVVEQRAIQLAQAVEKEWLSIQSKRGRPTGKWVRKLRGKTRPQLKVEEVISIAAPVIEEFAATKIVFGRPSFRALHSVVEAYSEATSRNANRWLEPGQPLSQSVRQALSRYRRATAPKEPIS